MLVSRELYPNYCLMREWAARDVQEDVHYFHTLPLEILYMIFELLDGESVNRLAQTCRLMSDIAKDDYLWHFLLARDYPHVGRCYKPKAVYARQWNMGPSRRRRKLYTKPCDHAERAGGYLGLAPALEIKS
mmetsp:Transcript_12488/g.49991  ORF Transcript_12488/g.49991 Transcript_12488/m.49991 type:complete len:131 (+) Transcript_12488:3-395(+)